MAKLLPDKCRCHPDAGLRNRNLAHRPSCRSHPLNPHSACRPMRIGDFHNPHRRETPTWLHHPPTDATARRTCWAGRWGTFEVCRVATGVARLGKGHQYQQRAAQLHAGHHERVEGGLVVGPGEVDHRSVFPAVDRADPLDAAFGRPLVLDLLKAADPSRSAGRRTGMSE